MRSFCASVRTSPFTGVTSARPLRRAMKALDVSVTSIR
jgi:hypothetical protein